MYSIGVCTHCMNIEVVGPSRDACLRCGKPFSHSLELTELAAPLEAPPAAATVYQPEIPEVLEFKGICPYCTGPLAVRLSEADFAIEADVAAAAAGMNGTEPSEPSPDPLPSTAAGEPDDVPEAAIAPETAPQPA